MKRVKVLSLLLAAAMIVTLVSGCGQKSSGDTIKVGLNYELTGEVAQYGQACADGIEMAIAEINAARNTVRIRGCIPPSTITAMRGST